MKVKYPRSGKVAGPSTQPPGSPQADSGQALRERAEAITRGQTTRMPEDLETLPPEAVRRALHDLQVHQIELEMQNQELRRTQKELQASRARYFDLYDLAPVGHFTLNEKDLILESNLTAAKLLGVSRGALAMQPLSRFILPEDQDTHCRHRKRLQETGVPQEWDLRLLRKDAAPFWARVKAAKALDTGGASVWRAVVSDISGHKRAEEALRMSLEELRVREELVRIALRSSPVVLFHQNADLRYIWVYNASTQHPTLTLLNRLDSDLFPADEAEQLTHWKRAVLTSGAGSQNKIVLTSQGQSRTFDMAIEPFRDSSGKVAGILGTAVDITDRVHREEQLSNLSAHLQSVHETVLALTSTEIHDNIGQTLAALNLELSVVASDLTSAVNLDVTLDHMKAISHLLATTAEWSERLSSGLRPSLLDNLGLAAAIESAAREFGSRTGIAVIARPLENIGMKPELSTALFRIVQEGLTMVRHANATEVTVSLRRQDRGMLLQIRHNGPDIANEDLTEPSPDLSARSLELLALRERVRSFGGRTRIEDVAGRGATISIEIPISEQIPSNDVSR